MFINLIFKNWKLKQKKLSVTDGFGIDDFDGVSVFFQVMFWLGKRADEWFFNLNFVIEPVTLSVTP